MLPERRRLVDLDGAAVRIAGMARTRITNHAGIDYLASWPDKEFWPWFGGYLDGEGCFYVAPDRSSVDINVSSTNRDIIESIHRRIGAGYIEEITFDQPGWNTKYSWRLRTHRDAMRVIIWVRPYLTIKAEAADRALQVLGEIRARVDARRWRQAQIVRLAGSGMSHRAIAEQVGVSRPTVSVTLKAAREEGLTADAIERGDDEPMFARKMRRWRQAHLKEKVTPITSRRRMSPK